MTGLTTRVPLVALVAAGLGAVILSLALIVFVGSAGFGYDFDAYDAAARRIVAGVSVYVPDTPGRYAAGAYEGLYLYPAPLALALTPLTVFSPDGATLAWLAIRVALLVLGCWALPVSAATRLGTFAIACVSFPVLVDLNLGNVNIVIFALCALAWRTADRPIAAVAHAILVAMRFPFGVFFLEWLVERRFRMIAWTIAAGLVIILVSLPIVGVASYMDYLTILRSLPDISTGPHNHSLKTTALALGLSDGIAAALPLVGYVLGAAAVVFASLRRDRDTAFVVTALSTLLVTPFIHQEYLVLLLLPTALLVHRGARWAIVLPLFGWLPVAALPLAGPLAIGLALAFGRGSTGRAPSDAVAAGGAPPAVVEAMP